MFISRIFLIILTVIIITLTVIKYAQSDLIIPQYYVQSEYRKDSIDYNDMEKTFYRNKAKILFSKGSRFNFTYIYMDELEEDKFTFNLVLNDISRNCNRTRSF